MIAIGFDSSSAKYIAASFFATYCSGLTHPLDVVKTRLQSKGLPIEVTMGEDQVRTWCPNTALFDRPLSPYIKVRDYMVSSRAFTSLCCANPWPFRFSFGCTDLFIKL